MRQQCGASDNESVSDATLFLSAAPVPHPLLSPRASVQMSPATKKRVAEDVGALLLKPFVGTLLHKNGRFVFVF